MKLVAVSFSRETENFISWVEFDYFLLYAFRLCLISYTLTKHILQVTIHMETYSLKYAT